MKKTFNESPLRDLGFNEPDLLSHLFFNLAGKLFVTPQHAYIRSAEHEYKVAMHSCSPAKRKLVDFSFVSHFLQSTPDLASKEQIGVFNYYKLRIMCILGYITHM